jgi:hypothetical protein
MGYDTRCFSADVLAMAVAGHLRIHHEDGWLSDGWGLERTGARSTPPTDPGQRKLLDSLFPGGATRIELKKANAAAISGAHRAHTRALEKELQPRYFRRNAGSVTIALLIAVGTALLAFFLSDGAGIDPLAPGCDAGERGLDTAGRGVVVGRRDPRTPGSPGTTYQRSRR